MSLFLESLQELMIENELNIVSFAKRIDRNKSAVRRWLYGNYYPEPSTLIKISKTFNISIDYLFGLSDNKNIFPVNNNGTFYERYTTLKSASNFSDYYVAKTCNLRTSTIAKWKKIQNIPETATLLELVKCFSCSLDYLLGLTKYK